MLYRETIVVCSQIHIKHINTVCRQNIQLLNIKLEVYIVNIYIYICVYIYIYVCMCARSLCCVALCRQTHCNVPIAASRLLLKANNPFIVSSEFHYQ